MLWLSSREVFWIICLGQSRILSVEWYPSMLWRLAVSYLSLMASSLRWASQNPPEVSFSLGFSPCPLQDSQGQTHASFSLQSPASVWVFPPSMSSLEIQPFPALTPMQPHNLFPLHSSTLLDASSVRRLGMGWERRSRRIRPRSSHWRCCVLVVNVACGQVTGEHFCVDDSQGPRTGVALHMVEKAHVESGRPDSHSCPWQAG